jgi:hypothetical protein
MEESPNRRELERRLAQAKRMAVSTSDAVTVERLTRLVAELEGQLRLSDSGSTGKTTERKDSAGDD